MPQIDAASIEPLWIATYYDGPLTGAVMHDGELCWYTLAEQDEALSDSDRDWRYWLIRLTPAQRAEEQRWHDLFRAHVGTHWDYPYGIEPSRMHSTENHHFFYEPHSRREQLVLDDNEVIGWFEF